MMIAAEYMQLAMRTANPSLGFKMRLENAALGLVGEAGEICDIVKKARHQGHPLDFAKLRGEAGDTCWYVAQACDVLGLTIESLPLYGSRCEYGFVPEDPTHLAHIALQLAAECGTFADRAVARIYSDDATPSSKVFQSYLGGVQTWLMHLCFVLDISIEKVWEMNIAKLRARYPDGFSAEASISRKDVER